MKGKRKCLILTAVLVILTGINFTPQANASILITEILADPPAGSVGDANNDGVTDSRDDEFVELFNDGALTVDLFGWAIEDAVGVRHLFEDHVILNPYSYGVVFGSDASTGTLGLNNGGDVISLFDHLSELVDRVEYGALAGNDQSVVRFPEENDGEWILHTQLEGQEGVLFSPGRGQYEAPRANVSAVPEMPVSTSILLGLAFGSVVFRRRALEVIS